MSTSLMTGCQTLASLDNWRMQSESRTFTPQQPRAVACVLRSGQRSLVGNSRGRYLGIPKNQPLDLTGSGHWLG